MEADTLERQAARGDERAFTALMTASKAALYRFVRRYVGDDDEAFDVVQEAYASAWLAIRRYDPERSFDTWLRSIAINKCRDWGRRRQVRRVVRGVMGLDAPEATQVGDDTPDAETQLADQRGLDRVAHAITDLPDGLKSPLLLSALEGRSHAEIAAIMGLSTKAVELRVARARRKLHEVLGRGAD